MKLDPNDPLLTAYALGELNDVERQALEARLAESPEAREALAEIQDVSQRLTSGLEQEPLPRLTSLQHDAIRARAVPGTVQPAPLPGWRQPAWWGLAAAACLALALLILPSKPPRTAGNRMDLAQLTTTDADRSSSRPEINSLDPTAPGLADKNTSANGSENRKTPDASRRPSFTEAGVPKEEPASSRTSPLPVRLHYPEQVGQKLPSDPVRRIQPTFDYDPRITVEKREREAMPQAQTPTTLPVPVSPRAALPEGAAKVTSRGQSYQYSPAPARESRLQPTAETAVVRKASKMSSEASPSRVLNSEQRLGFEARPHLLAPGDAGVHQNTASYPAYVENPFLSPLEHPLSTFSIDVDTASYANVRRFLNSGQMPPRDAIRIEELINYFTYDYPQPGSQRPFAVNLEVAGCPWNPDHRLVRVGLKGRELGGPRPPSNFVFLIDVSGSMRPPERLPLVKQALRQLVRQMNPSDRVAIVIYATSAGVALPSTSGSEKEKIFAAIDRLDSGGSTNGGEGIQQAYAIAAENFIEGGVNRVLLCTDGDFNVGLTDQGQLIRLIEDKARIGVFLTTLGVGTDNYKDSLMQNLANKGNGNYHYLDSLEEAHKVLVHQLNATLVTIAKDVKIQIEFNPARVGSYRLIGYEKRILQARDFHDDRKDAGEIGAGHTVTALYEIIPPHVTAGSGRHPGPLKYQPAHAPGGNGRPENATIASLRGDVAGSVTSTELLTLKLRYKTPEGIVSDLVEFTATDGGGDFREATADFRFAAAVAEFGLVLKSSEFKGRASLSSALETAQGAKGPDEYGYRAEFLNLVRKAMSLQRR